MLNQTVARRYARALFELAHDKGQIEQVDREFAMVVDIIQANRPLKATLDDVLISPNVKRDLVTKLFTGKVSDLLMNFMLLVVRKRREAHLSAMYRAYQDLANEAQGIVEVEVRSAVELPQENLAALQQKLGTRFGKRVKLQTQVAPELLGGLVVRVGDELMDGSVKTRLIRMRERLIHSKAE